MNVVVSPKISPFVEFLYRELADGEWHDREPLLVRTIPHVPPGPAHRAGLLRRATAPAEDHDKDITIRVGARFMISRAFTNRLTFEHRTHDGRKQIRLTPNARARAQLIAERTRS